MSGTCAATAEAYVTERAAEWAAGKGFWFGIWLAETLVGQIQIKNLDWSVPKGELAYLLDGVSQRMAAA